MPLDYKRFVVHIAISNYNVLGTLLYFRYYLLMKVITKAQCYNNSY